MVYQKVYSKEYKNAKTLSKGLCETEFLDCALDARYLYKIRLKGEIAIPYTNRVEEIYPVYLRKLEDSLSFDGTEYKLVFGDFNFEKERSCYYMCRSKFEINKPYNFSVKYKASGVDSDLTVTLEVYYGKQKTRYYYEKANEIYTININDAKDFESIEQQVIFKQEVDFLMVKICGTNFNGQAEFYTPSLKDDCGKEYIDKFEYNPENLLGLKWIGEGFSTSLRPEFRVSVNGKEIFSGRKYERQHRFSGVEFEIPANVLTGSDKIEIYYGNENRFSYNYKELQIIALPKDFEILGVSPYQTINSVFGVLVYSNKDQRICVKCDKNLQYLGEDCIQKGINVLRFMPQTLGKNVQLTLSINDVERKAIIKEIFPKKTDGILTGTGDLIYVNQNEKDFIEYIAWYLNEGVGNMITLRSCFRWGATSELDQNFWKKIVKILCDLGIYYCLMTDGRELNGVNANPSQELLNSEYFLGEQTHERDGAYTYWDQKIDDSETLFYHLLSRKLERNGIYGKASPVYNSKGEGCIYYTGEGITDVKQAYESLKEKLKSTGADGATRHTGVTPFFNIFLESGYKWVGYESLYGSHEMIFGALRGASTSNRIKDFGSHIALQWSTVPAYDYAHALRYKLSLYLAYMHGANWINTEEGIWNIENLFVGFDRFTEPCIMHKKEQSEFFKFIQSHNRSGKMVRKIAMIQGKYDGMDCFSTGRVYGQYGKEWEYSSPEKSWDLLKVFYPQAKIGAVYNCVYKGGENALKEQDAELYKTLTGRYGTILDYQSLGFFTSTPYGVIDIIPAEADNFADYEVLFFTGWNTCTNVQLKKLCNYLASGGTLLLCRSHLFDSVSRKEVFDKKANVIDSPLVNELLSYQDKGNLIYFDENDYPANIRGYAEKLTELAKAHRSKFVTETQNVSFTEYLEQDGTTTLYMINIDWWERKPAKCKINLNGIVEEFVFDDNDIHIFNINEKIVQII